LGYEIEAAMTGNLWSRGKVVPHLDFGVFRWYSVLRPCCAWFGVLWEQSGSSRCHTALSAYSLPLYMSDSRPWSPTVDAVQKCAT